MYVIEYLGLGLKNMVYYYYFRMYVYVKDVINILFSKPSKRILYDLQLVQLKQHANNHKRIRNQRIP